MHIQELECLSFIAKIIKSIDENFHVPTELASVNNLNSDRLWDTLQAQKWEKVKYREGYPNHSFEEIFEEAETSERDFNEQELKEEELVVPSIIGKIDEGKNIAFNKLNSHRRDKRIIFYPEPHIYTIDNIPAPSASEVIGKFFPEFDSEYWSIRKSKDLGMSIEEVALMWKADGERVQKKEHSFTNK